MKMNQIRRGSGKPLLLTHGLGGSWRSWRPILDDLSAERRVIAIDLPGFGKTPPLPGEVSIATLAEAVTAFPDAHDFNRRGRGWQFHGRSAGARIGPARRGGRHGFAGSWGLLARLATQCFLFLRCLVGSPGSPAAACDAAVHGESAGPHFALVPVFSSSVKLVSSVHVRGDAQLCRFAFVG